MIRKVKLDKEKVTYDGSFNVVMSNEEVLRRFNEIRGIKMDRITIEQFNEMNSLIFNISKSLDLQCDVRNLLFQARMKLAEAYNLSELLNKVKE